MYDWAMKIVKTENLAKEAWPNFPNVISNFHDKSY